MPTSSELELAVDENREDVSMDEGAEVTTIVAVDELE